MGVARRAVTLDEALLDHHHRLGRQQVIAVVGVDVEAGGGDRVALAEHHVVGHAAGAVALAEPAVHTAAAEGVDEPAVPAARGSPRIRVRCRRIVQHGNLVDRAVDGAGLNAYDVGHRGAVQRGRGRDVGRPHGGIRQLLQLAVGGAVDVVDAARDRAVVVERRAEGSAPLRLERLGLAGERLLVGPGEHRPLQRVIHQRQRAERCAVRAGQHQLAIARQPLDQTQ